MLSCQLSCIIHEETGFVNMFLHSEWGFGESKCSKLRRKGCVFLKRLFALLLCLCLLSLPARAQEPDKLVALTFDDGPSGRFTRALLEGLEERGVKSTFLLCGYRMEQYPKLTQMIHEAGHEIGLHGYSHDPMDQMCLRDLCREIDKTTALLPDGCKASFLRPPGGQFNALTKSAAESRDLALLSWSVDPRDWATKNAAAVEAHVLYQVRDGDIVLLHDMSNSSVEAALAIVDKLLAQGFRFVTVSQLAKEKGVTAKTGQVYYRFDG